MWTTKCFARTIVVLCSLPALAACMILALVALVGNSLILCGKEVGYFFLIVLTSVIVLYVWKRAYAVGCEGDPLGINVVSNATVDASYLESILVKEPRSQPHDQVHKFLLLPSSR